jgi:hypothetical protein
MKKKYLIAGLVVVGLGISGYAFAQVATGQLSACVSKDGETKFIVTGFTKKQTCGKGEQLMTWNIAGTPCVQGPKGDQGNVGEQGPAGLPGVGTKLVLKDKGNQLLGIYLTTHRGATTSQYSAFNQELGVNLNFISANNWFSGDETSAELDVVKCNTPVYFSDLSCTESPQVQAILGCWEANSITEIGGRYFYQHAWTNHPHDQNANSVLTSDGVCTSYPGIGVRAENVFGGAREVVLPFTFPVRLPLKIVPG